MSEPRYPYLHLGLPDTDADETAVELLSSQLFELGAQGIEERDSSTLARTQEKTLVASFEDDATALAALAELTAGGHRAHLEHVVGDAWREAWRQYFKPLRIGERLVVKPSWEPFDARPEDLVITLDPGQAFGTGTHESTQLVLAALSGHVRPGVRALDLGTGSGILAIAALLLGAEHVTAIDTDPLAISATEENAEANGFTERISASTTPLAHIREQFPLVLANIEAHVLVPLAAAVAERVAPGGTLILSGLLLADGAPVRAAYPAFEQIDSPQSGQWCALVLRKGSA